MSQLPQIERNTSAILSAVEFNSGNRYADFNPAPGDKVASYGIAALVAGGVAAKLGFFKGLWILILGAKKLSSLAWQRLHLVSQAIRKEKHTRGIDILIVVKCQAAVSDRGYNGCIPPSDWQRVPFCHSERSRGISNYSALLL